ncbi:VF530 family DNA-binding protein [Legionella longbeachae]|uniref:VF530 family protein n=1 Tax=Legionella longbeachae TaxID=450 RepID=UPI0005A0E55D|nr:VF530 family protein [Legionella longbeachae]
MDRISNDPLHGITLEAILNSLLICYGWEGLAERVKVNCFSSNPSIKSSLKFLRKTPWARKEIETLYLTSLKDKNCDKS